MKEYALIIPDTHIPYHHPKALELTLQFAQTLGQTLKEIVILGDFADFYAVNSHGKSPDLMHLLKSEIDEVNFILDQIDKAFPLTKKIYLEGNHEYRLERYLVKNAPALFGLTQWEYLFKLPQRPNWLSIPYTFEQAYPVLGTSLLARHEPYSMSSAKASLARSKCNLIYGHKHVREEHTERTPKGEKLINLSPGWLGNIRATKIFGFVKNVPHWELGFALLEKENNFWSIQNILIHDNISFQALGKTFK